MITDALRQIMRFRGDSLKETIADIEKQLNQAAGKDAVCKINSNFGLDRALIASAAQIKRASAQIDVIIHTAGILYALPHILEDGEVVESASLGAGNAGSEFDLVTNRRIAEFKFIYWQGGSESVRKKTFFEDYVKLVGDKSKKKKYFYLLNTTIPLNFLMGKSQSLRMLDRNARAAGSFREEHGAKYPTVGQFYAAHKDEVVFVDLVKLIPDLVVLVGLPPSAEFDGD